MSLLLIESFAALRALCPPRKKFLVGVSGGADSMALLYLLMEAGIQSLVVCHLNHQLRGAEANCDEAFVNKTCLSLGLVFRSRRVNVGKIAQKTGDSLEHCARLQRHIFFAECARAERCSRVILAHHAEDQAETLLWNVLRGSHGWKGMREQQEIVVNKRKLCLLRPLLAWRREQLRAYLQERNLSWREDASNAETFATRNRLRNEVLPLLADVAQRDVVPMLTRQLEAREEQQEVENWALAQCRALDPQGRLHRPSLLALPPAMQLLVLRDYLKQQQISEISRSLLSSCRELIVCDERHCVNLPGGRFFHRRAGRLFVGD